MILLADVGASTAKVVYIGSMFPEGKTIRAVHKGFNPTYHTEEELYERISRWSVPNGTANDIHSVIFYGAGCMRFDRAQKVSRVLKKHFHKERTLLVLGLWRCQPDQNSLPSRDQQSGGFQA